MSRIPKKITTSKSTNDEDHQPWSLKRSFPVVKGGYSGSPVVLKGVKRDKSPGSAMSAKRSYRRVLSDLQYEEIQAKSISSPANTTGTPSRVQVKTGDILRSAPNKEVPSSTSLSSVPSRLYNRAVALTPPSRVRKTDTVDIDNKRLTLGENAILPMQQSLTHSSTPSARVKAPGTPKSVQMSRILRQDPAVSDRRLTACFTPGRVAKKSPSKFTPARIQPKTPDSTPELMSGKEVSQPLIISNTPGRILKKSPSRFTPARISFKPSESTPRTSKQQPGRVLKKSPRFTPARISYKTPESSTKPVKLHKPESVDLVSEQGGENHRDKLPTSKPAYDETWTVTMDGKSPVFKEFLGQIDEEKGHDIAWEDCSTHASECKQVDDAVSPSEYRNLDMPFVSPVKVMKKELTWAQILAGCSDENLPEIKSKDKPNEDGCIQTAAGSILRHHHEMQGSSSQEKIASSPVSDISHSSSETTTKNSTSSAANMQLPVCALVPHSHSHLQVERDGLKLNNDNAIVLGTRHDRSASSSGKLGRFGTMTAGSSGQNCQELPGNSPTVTQGLEACLLYADSPMSVSQPQSGQDNSKYLARNAERLQEHIKQYEEKRLQLAKLKSHIDCMAQNQSDSNGNENSRLNYLDSDDQQIVLIAQVDNGNTTGDSVTNTEYLKQNTSSEYRTESQGFDLLHDVEIDLNSNMTVKTPATERLDLVKQSDVSPELDCKQTLNFSSSPSEATDYSRQWTNVSSEVAISTRHEPRSGAHMVQSFFQQAEDLDHKDVPLKTSNRAASPIVLEEEGHCTDHENKSNINNNSKNMEGKSNVSSIMPPLWTPMALRSVARQQQHSTNQTQRDAEDQHIDDSTMTGNVNVTSIGGDENEQYPDGLVPEGFDKSSSTVQESDGTDKVALHVNIPPSVAVLKTPPSAKQSFRNQNPHHQSGLSPNIGSMSLTASCDSTSKPSKTYNKPSCNRDIKTESHVPSASLDAESLSRPRYRKSLSKELLQVSDDRYMEALLDNEVELFMCRLSANQPQQAGHVTCGASGRCFNPVARMLLEGDNMHFIPIQDSDLDIAHGEVRIRGSAFTKVVTGMSC